MLSDFLASTTNHLDQGWQSLHALEKTLIALLITIAVYYFLPRQLR